MKKRILLSVFVVFLVLEFIGCGIIPDINQEEKVKGIVIDYWLALSNKQYELAKTYCIPHGFAYSGVEDYQNLFYYNYMTLDWTPYINWVEIIGSEAIVNMDVTFIVIVCFEDICSTESETFYNYFMVLAKIDGVWKLK